jgi:hypothetical protein
MRKNRRLATLQANPFRLAIAKGFSKEPSFMILGTAAIEVIRYSALLTGFVVSCLIRRQ